MSRTSSLTLFDWLKHLARFQPAPWHWPRALRAALSVGLPFAIGLAMHDIMTGMWIAMGTLMMTTGEETGPYGRVLRHLFMAAPMGAAGYLAGYLTGLPWLGTVFAMATLGLLAGLISSYSTVLSIGCLQFLLTAAIAIGVPTIAPFWEPAALYLLGALIYALLLGAEAVFFSQRPQREALAKLLRTLATLAEHLAQGTAKASTYRQVTDSLAAFEAALPSRTPLPGGFSYLPALKACDTLFALLLATGNTETLQTSAKQLRLLATAAATGQPLHVGPYPTDRLANPLRALTELLGSLNSGRAPERPLPMPDLPPAKKSLHAPDRSAVLSACSLALCLGLAYASRWVNPESHWFWVPLTVGLVMKPDLGSIFARALLRAIGTLAGVLIGSPILMLVPKNFVFAALMAVLAGVLPWAMKRSYALQAVVLTPLVLMLVDIIAPGSGDANYALQRLSDTLIGGAIVMVFGYWIWPKRQAYNFIQIHQQCRNAVLSYLNAALAAPSGAVIEETQLLRHEAYARLAHARIQVSKSLADPPPAHAEASAFVPVFASLTRICDAITRYVADSNRNSTAPVASLEQFVQRLQPHPHTPAPYESEPECVENAEQRLARKLKAELTH